MELLSSTPVLDKYIANSEEAISKILLLVNKHYVVNSYNNGSIHML
jgi:hypothetical protein